MLLVRESPIVSIGQILLPASALSLMALLLQRVLPSRRVPIMPLIPGSILIGLGLSLLNVSLSLSLVSLGNRFQAYGVIGGVLVLTSVGVVGRCHCLFWSVLECGTSSLSDEARCPREIRTVQLLDFHHYSAKKLIFPGADFKMNRPPLFVLIAIGLLLLLPAGRWSHVA